MKKLLCALLVIMVFICSFAFADETPAGDMIVVNCEEWVSLRAQPSTEAERLMKIPLGSIVNDCVIYDDGWVYGSFEDNYGYISGDYLSVYENPYTYNMVSADFGDISVVACYDNYDNSESYHIEAYNADGNPIWWHNVYCSYTTELQMVDVFFAGTEENPLVMAYSAETGLEALDLSTGAVLWRITSDQLSLGGSICYAVDTDGTIYAGGFYGPDPVAISASGEVLWQADFLGAYYWLYEIAVEGDILRCEYDMDDSTYEPATVLIAKNGDFLGLSY